MKKDEVGNVIKRYNYIIDAVKNDLPRAVFYTGNRKQVVMITPEMKSVCEIIEIVYENETDEWIKAMIKEILSGKSDSEIMMDLYCSKNFYYSRKKTFLQKVYDLCIYRNLVTYEEILKEKIA